MQPVIVSGTVIDRRYQIQKKIKDNTSNCCYLAEDTTQSNRLVILSFPRIELLILPGFANAFQDACNNLESARISSLVKVLDSGVYESQPYAVLQNITHEPLATTFESIRESGHKSTVESVLDWATPLAVSLDELHDADYIHSNVRPGSVYLGSTQLILGDFVTEFALQRMGKFKGAISTLDVSDYLAPEYIKSNYTPAYDQYMLATLVYQALANSTPFSDARGGDEYRMQVATLLAEPLSKSRPELAAVSDVLAKALERNPANRFSSCREFISELRSAQESSAKVVPLKPALNPDISNIEEEVEITVDPIVTSIRNEGMAGKGKKGLMWLGVLLLGSAAVAYTVVSQNGADQITSNPAKIKEEAGQDTIVAVSVEAPVPLETAKLTDIREQIVQEALLAQKEVIEEPPAKQAEPEPEPVKKKPQALKESSNRQVQARDFSELNNAISLAVNAGQKEFLEEQKQAQLNAGTSSSIDVSAITGHVSEAVKDEVEAKAVAAAEEAQRAKELEQERLHQELLAAEALVKQREAAQKRVEAAARLEAEKRAEQQERQGVSRNQAQTPESEEAATAEQTADSAADEQADNDKTPKQPVLSERERILAFKKKELARIEGVTKDCVVGGKIHREAAAGNLAFVKSCLAVGVDANVSQSDGWTLLHIAARSGHLNMSKLLVAKGARVNAKSGNGLTALDMANAQKKPRVASYLKTRGGLTTR